jgi:hypothetical protein
LSAIENRFNKPEEHMLSDDLIAVLLTAAQTDHTLTLTAEQRSKGTVLKFEQFSR